jgi:hypothetical protein
MRRPMCGGWKPATCGWRGGGTDLEVTHPLHTLRPLIDAPLPLFAAGLY